MKLNFASKLNSIRALSLLLVCSIGLSAVAAPLLEKQPLFTPTETNYYHIPGLIVTAKGTVLAYAAWRQVGIGDWGAIHPVLRRSTDGGVTWSAERQIAPVGTPPEAVVRTSPPKTKGHETDIVVDNAMMIADTNGTVHFVYCVEYRRVFYTHSEDDGLTFAPPVEISQAFEKFRPQFNWKIVATGPGHGFQMRNGRLIIPCWLATGGKGGYQHAPSESSTLYSDDHGATWQCGDVVAGTTGTGANTNVYHNANETVGVQLADGSVLFNIRAPSARHRKLESISPDGFSGWSKPEFIQDLPEPVCFGAIERLSMAPKDDKNRLLFSIDTGTALGKKKAIDEQGYVRADMGVFVSYDEGKTWPVKRVIQDGPCGCGYSDLAVLPDGTMLCAYGSGPVFGKGAGIALARFNLEWLSAGKDSLVRTK